jgi:hypothetical protein
MEPRDWVLVVAMIIAPLFAVQVQKWIERFRERKGKKLRIFNTLMSTRMARVSPNHVDALNMIDIEFYHSGLFRFTREWKKDKAVIDAWRSYLDHLNSLGENPTEVQTQTLVTRKDELFIDPLYEISQAVGYEFDKVNLKHSIYSPKAHGTDEMEQRIVREGLVSILSGKKPFPIKIFSAEDSIGKLNPPTEQIS